MSVRFGCSNRCFDGFGLVYGWTTGVRNWDESFGTVPLAVCGYGPLSEAEGGKMFRSVALGLVTLAMAGCGSGGTTTSDFASLPQNVKDWCSDEEAYYRISYDFRDKPMTQEARTEEARLVSRMRPVPEEIIEIYPEAEWDTGYNPTDEEISSAFEHLQTVARFCGFPDDLVTYVDSFAERG